MALLAMTRNVKGAGVGRICSFEGCSRTENDLGGQFAPAVLCTFRNLANLVLTNQPPFFSGVKYGFLWSVYYWAFLFLRGLFVHIQQGI